MTYPSLNLIPFGLCEFQKLERITNFNATDLKLGSSTFLFLSFFSFFFFTFFFLFSIFLAFTKTHVDRPRDRSCKWPVGLAIR